MAEHRAQASGLSREPALTAQSQWPLAGASVSPLVPSTPQPNVPGQFPPASVAHVFEDLCAKGLLAPDSSPSSPRDRQAVLIQPRLPPPRTSFCTPPGGAQ